MSVSQMQTALLKKLLSLSTMEDAFQSCFWQMGKNKQKSCRDSLIYDESLSTGQT